MTPMRRTIPHFCSAAIAVPAALALAMPAAADTTEAEAQRLEEIAAFFSEAVVVSGPEVVDCTLSEGTQTRCFSITVKPEPIAYTPGPWCPTNISDDASKGGKWFGENELLDVDGSFVEHLDEFFGDDEWALYNPETGEIRVTDTLESCDGAARPDVAEEYQNYCVQCLPEYLDDGASMTYVIPLEPQAASAAGRLDQGSGVAYNGVRLDASAPQDAIVAAHTIAPLDDCGGHVNLHVGYHYHAVTDCLPGAPVMDEQEAEEVAASEDAVLDDATSIGIAMDGYLIYNRANSEGEVVDGLDECNGHATEALGYHYHAGAEGSNAILACMTAQYGCALEDGDASCDASVRQGPPGGGPRPDGPPPEGRPAD